MLTGSHNTTKKVWLKTECVALFQFKCFCSSNTHPVLLVSATCIFFSPTNYPNGMITVIPVQIQIAVFVNSSSV